MLCFAQDCFISVLILKWQRNPVSQGQGSGQRFHRGLGTLPVQCWRIYCVLDPAVRLFIISSLPGWLSSISPCLWSNSHRKPLMMSVVTTFMDMLTFLLPYPLRFMPFWVLAHILRHTDSCLSKRLFCFSSFWGSVSILSYKSWSQFQFVFLTTIFVWCICYITYHLIPWIFQWSHKTLYMAFKGFLQNQTWYHKTNDVLQSPKTRQLHLFKALRHVNLACLYAEHVTAENSNHTVSCLHWICLDGCLLAFSSGRVQSLKNQCLDYHPVIVYQQASPVELEHKFK